MSDLKSIQHALKEYFGSIVTIDKLESPNGSKTVSRAKQVGVYLAHQDKHGNAEIAKAFGYEDGHSVSNVFSRVQRNAQKDHTLLYDIRMLAEKLSIQCDLF